MVSRRKDELRNTYGGRQSSSVPGGCTGTGDQDELGVRISRPGWKARWNRRVREPGHLLKMFFPLDQLEDTRSP